MNFQVYGIDSVLSKSFRTIRENEFKKAITFQFHIAYERYVEQQLVIAVTEHALDRIGEWQNGDARVIKE